MVILEERPERCVYWTKNRLVWRTGGRMNILFVPIPGRQLSTLLPLAVQTMLMQIKRKFKFALNVVDVFLSFVPWFWDCVG